MTRSLFITGASGFIGSRLLQELDRSKYDHIYCLCRSQDKIPKFQQKDGRVQIVQGGIHDFKRYAPYLAFSDTVVHLAAATGKLSREEYFDVNARGTELLIGQCEQAGVKNFLHISTIAVKYLDKSHYYYAQSKERGERAVKSSELNYTIVRPTIVVGTDGATWNSLAKLAKAPIVPLFGDGTTKIQPIYVDDLISLLLTILDQDIFKNETYELGGPERITFESFLKRIHHTYFNKEPRLVHIPLKPLRTMLTILEDRFCSVLPVTTGQLSAFDNDGTTQMNELFRQHNSTLKGVQEMLDLVIRQQKDEVQCQKLNSECRAFTNYLIGCDPSDYILEKYREAHTKVHIFEDIGLSAFDRFLLTISTQHPFVTKIVDAYTSFFFRRSIFRKKTILLLSILENCAPTCSFFDTPDSSRKLIVLLKLFQRGVVFTLFLLLSTVLLFPIHIVFSVHSKTLFGGR